jgi:protein-tyrosine phosphatase
MTIKDMQTRILAWEGCYNARELGGYATENGRETRWGRVVRADDLNRLSAAGRQALIDHGVRTIVDLRLPRELEIDPPPFREHDAVAYHHVSFIDPDAEPGPSIERIADDYKQMLERHRSGVAAIMQAIARAPEGAVLIHCHAGKDRTGTIAALLLRLAGVPIATAAEDYGLTTECLRPFDEEWLENGPNDRAWREREYARTMARAEVMQEVLEYVEDQYGSVEDYLLTCGVSPEDVARLKAKLLE